MPLSLSLVLILAHLFVLPGALLLLVTPSRWQYPGSTPLVLPLSLAIGFYLTIALVAVGWFSRPILLGLILMEFIALALLWRFTRAPLWDAPQRGLYLWLALGAFGVFAPALWNAITHVFEHGDSVLSWNRWALDWAAGRFPRYMMSYPQLVPVTWANLYVALGTPLENLARVIAPTLAALATLLLAALALHRRSLALALAAAVNALLIWQLLGAWLDDGYADTALVFFATATMYPLLAIAPGSSPAKCLWAALTSLFLATAAAHTKQGGLFLLLMHPLLVALWLRDHRGWDRTALLRYLGSALLGALVLVAPWYAVKHGQVVAGRGFDIAAYLIAPGGWHGDETLPQRLTTGLDRLDTALGTFNAWLIGIAFALAALTPRYRWLIGAVLLPYTLLWAATFNYDTRNLAVILPLIALTAGQGLAVLVGSLRLNRLWPRRWPAWLVTRLALLTRGLAYGVLVLLLVALGGLALVTDRLGSWQARQMAARGAPWANAVALDLHARGLLNEPFLSNYRWLEALAPINRTFDRYYERQDYRNFIHPFRDVEALRTVGLRDPLAPRRILLFANVAPYALPPTLIADVGAAARQGDFLVLEQGENWLLLENDTTLR